MQPLFPFTSMQLHIDNYEGITINNTTMPDTLELFEKELQNILQHINDKKLLWIKLPIEKSHFIPLLTRYDFIFHHCNENNITLLKKLIQNPIIPTAKNHTLGVGVVVINEKDELLVIKDRLSKQFKIPGGYIDDGENISNAAVREVKEETGILVDFLGVIAIGHFKPLQFGESNLYIGCTAKALSETIEIFDTYEIIAAQWLPLKSFFAHKEISPFQKSIVETSIQKKPFNPYKINFLTQRAIDYEIFL